MDLMMGFHEGHRLMIKGLVSEFNLDEACKFEECKKEIEGIFKKYDSEKAMLALTLVMMEKASEEGKK